jgi:hypothetical protein
MKRSPHRTVTVADQAALGQVGTAHRLQQIDARLTFHDSRNDTGDGKPSFLVLEYFDGPQTLPHVVKKHLLTPNAADAIFAPFKVLRPDIWGKESEAA